MLRSLSCCDGLLHSFKYIQIYPSLKRKSTWHSLIENGKCLLKFHILLSVFRLFLGGSLCFFLVYLILQDFFDGLLLGRLFAFFCAGCGFPYPVADVPQLLQVLLYLGQRCFQSCNFFQKRFLLLLQLLLGAVLIVRVLGKVGGSFLIPGNLRVFLFEFLLCFLKKYL